MSCGQRVEPCHLGSQLGRGLVRVDVQAQRERAAVGGVDPERGVEAVVHEPQPSDVDRVAPAAPRTPPPEDDHLCRRRQFLECAPHPSASGHPAAVALDEPGRGQRCAHDELGEMGSPFTLRTSTLRARPSFTSAANASAQPVSSLGERER